MSAVAQVSKSGMMAWAHRVARNECEVTGSGDYRNAKRRAMTKAWGMTRQGYSFTAYAFQSYSRAERRAAT